LPIEVIFVETLIGPLSYHGGSTITVPLGERGG